MTNQAQTSQPDLHLSPICWSRLGHNLANQVDVVRNGAEAIDHLITCAVPGQSPPRFVLLDLKLPKIDGLEVLRGYATTSGPSSRLW